MLVRSPIKWDIQALVTRTSYTIQGVKKVSCFYFLIYLLRVRELKTFFTTYIILNQDMTDI